ncbi:MAG: hypothetical protein LQ351_007809 [Letrouitia transgressa]|nr:MAG: hypothetical protein LQ351_007809 [Letrouitia transgressa]
MDRDGFARRSEVCLSCKFTELELVAACFNLLEETCKDDPLEEVDVGHNQLSGGELPEDEVETENLAPEVSDQLDSFGTCTSIDGIGFTHRIGWTRVAGDTGFCGGLLRTLGWNN